MRHLLFLGLCALLGGCGDTIVNHYGDGGSVPGAGGELGGGGFSAVDAGDGGLGGGGDMADAGPGPADGGPMDGGGGGMGAVDDPPDLDGDGIPDAHDRCPMDPENDRDGDGICASFDPCPLDPDDDSDGDGLCDSDDPDLCELGDADPDRNGWADACDVVLWQVSGTLTRPGLDGASAELEVIAADTMEYITVTCPPLPSDPATRDCPASDATIASIRRAAAVPQSVGNGDVRMTDGGSGTFGSEFLRIPGRARRVSVFGHASGSELQAAISIRGIPAE